MLFFQVGSGADFLEVWIRILLKGSIVFESGQSQSGSATLTLTLALLNCEENKNRVKWVKRREKGNLRWKWIKAGEL